MKPSIGIFGLSGCWGEQIVILNCEDQLLELADRLDVADFLGASSAPGRNGPLAIAFVEGSVGSDRDEAVLRRVRARARLLVACGSCACFGGVAAACDDRAHASRVALVYGTDASGLDTRRHRPLRDFVDVDLSIPGCPMEKDDFLQAVACLLNGDMPERREYPVCAECRMAERECLLEAGIPCVGPITGAGCNARCPEYRVPCIGCRGPVDDANFDGMRSKFRSLGLADGDINRRLHMFAPRPAHDGEEAICP